MMYLNLIQDFAEKVSEAICKAMGTDVIIVSDDLKLIGNTFLHPNKAVPITKLSIVGTVIEKGEVIVIPDKRNYYGCKGCPDLDICAINGFVGVPIFFQEQAVGAICLLFPHRGENEKFQRVNKSIAFLEVMAQLLSSKIQSIISHNRLKETITEQELLISLLEEGVASTNSKGEILYSNGIFDKIFNSGQSATGTNIMDYLTYPLIKELYQSHAPLPPTWFYQALKPKSFYGKIHSEPILAAEEFRGMLFTVQSAKQVEETRFHTHLDVSISLDELVLLADHAFAKTLVRAKKLAPTMAPVFIVGEPYTGKSTLAKGIHKESLQRGERFVTIDCKKICSAEIEQILGEGQWDSNEGAQHLWQANEGTIFFRSIEYLPYYWQVKLLALLEEKRIAVKELGNIPFSCRYIFSAEKDIHERVEKGLFHPQLVDIIRGETLVVPPLRNQNKLLLHVLKYAMEFYLSKSSRTKFVMKQDALELLKNYTWPGNLLQLQQFCDGLVQISTDGIATVEDIRKLGIDSATEPESMYELEKKHIRRMLEENQYKSDIAKQLNMSRATLYRKIQKYKLNNTEQWRN